MDFSEEKARILKELSPLMENCRKVEKSLDLMLQRQNDTKSAIERLEAENKQLSENADDALATDPHAFEKFKDTLRKNNNSIAANKEGLKVLTDKIIPAKEKDVTEARKKLKNALYYAFRPLYNETQRQITEILSQAVALHDAFLDIIFSTLNETGLPDPGSHTNYITSEFDPQPVHPRITATNGGIMFSGKPYVPVSAAPVPVTAQKAPPSAVPDVSKPAEEKSPDEAACAVSSAESEPAHYEPQTPGQWSQNVFNNDTKPNEIEV